MSVSEELLMAYADGELDAADCTAERDLVEAAVRTDPSLAARVEQCRAMRGRLGALYAEAIEEPVPERLLAIIRAGAAAPDSATVTDLDAARAHKAAQPRRGWREWGAMAASLLVGLLVGQFVLRARGTTLISIHDGRVLAQASLNWALSHQLAGVEAENEPVRIGLSFRSKSGEYCRTFVMQQRESLGGLACRQGDVWRILALARAEPSTGVGGYHPAGSALPGAVRAAVEESMNGEPLDHATELQARQKDWH